MKTKLAGINIKVGFWGLALAIISTAKLPFSVQKKKAKNLLKEKISFYFDYSKKKKKNPFISLPKQNLLHHNLTINPPCTTPLFFFSSFPFFSFCLCAFFGPGKEILRQTQQSLLPLSSSRGKISVLFITSLSHQKSDLVYSVSFFFFHHVR